MTTIKATHSVNTDTPMTCTVCGGVSVLDSMRIWVGGAPIVCKCHNQLPNFNLFPIYDWTNRCPKCCKKYFDDGKNESTSIEQFCRCKELDELMEHVNKIPMGWKCPNCGSGVSPSVDICPCSIRIITTTGTEPK